ncbi:hypothetical protein, partial [Enterobacter cloacae complex sp. 2DZ2F20B]|uniref:hypothetical protein n=1 Tax=Enterobacter cloacae complex sp. 2DZ2F20B TaxID=2511993 RepID=UPI001CA4DF9F
ENVKISAKFEEGGTIGKFSLLKKSLKNSEKKKFAFTSSITPLVFPESSFEVNSHSYSPPNKFAFFSLI